MNHAIRNNDSSKVKIKKIQALAYFLNARCKKTIKE